MRCSIVKTKDPEIIKFLIPMIKELIRKNAIEDYTVEDFAKWLRWHLKSPYLGLWVAIQEGNTLLKESKKLVGYVVAGIQEFVCSEQVFVYHLYSNAKNRKVAQDLYKKVEKWAKENGINRLIALTNREKGLSKLFGAKKQGTVIVKEIQYE